MILHVILAIIFAILLFINLRVIDLGYLEPYSHYTLPFIVLTAIIMVARVVKKSLKIYFAKKASTVNVDRTRFVVFTKFVQAAIYVLGIILVIYTIPGLRQMSISLLAGAGVIAVIIGFATQELFANIVAGMFIAISEPFRVGDLVTVANEYGTIEDITLRHTIVRTWDNRRVIVPNSNIAKDTIINYSIQDDKILKYIDIGISYDSDIDLARRIIMEEVSSHPEFRHEAEEHLLLSASEDVSVRVLECGEYSIKLRAYFWAKDQPTAFKMGTDIIESVKKRFDKEGVEIPFPYRTLVYKNDLSKPHKMDKTEFHKNPDEKNQDKTNIGQE